MTVAVPVDVITLDVDTRLGVEEIDVVVEVASEIIEVVVGTRPVDDKLAAVASTQFVPLLVVDVYPS